MKSVHLKSTSDVIEEVKKYSKEKIKVAVTDIDGVLRGKYIHREKFLSALEGGFGFCNVVFGWDSSDVCYDNTSYTGWHTGYPDAKVRLDVQTFRKIPWEGGIFLLLGDFEDALGKPLPICPRQLLKEKIKELQSMGFSAKVGLEFEWFNFKETPQTLKEKQYLSPEPITPGMFGYSLLRTSLNQPFFSALMDELNDFGVPLEGLHTETGPGVFEAAILCSDPLEAADRGVLFKTGVKEIGYRFGILPTFMAKWNKSLPGCSGHLHQSLMGRDGQNLFYSEGEPQGMSALFRSYLAGQMHCLSEILPFFAPTVNSYKRLVEGFWAPTKVTWGVDNRTVAFRAIPGSSKSTRLETRVPGSDINPYLAVAAALGSGLYGVERKLKLDSPPIVGSAYQAKEAKRLPRNLEEASLLLSRSQVARDIFGETFVDHYVNTRLWEWRQYQESVTSWELQRYFEII